MTIRAIAKFVVSLLSLLAVAAASASAAGMENFSDEAYQKAQAGGKTIVLDFHADWCPTCKRQKVLLDELLGEKEFADFSAFKVDYDNSADLQKALVIPRQSTIVVMKGSQEVARSIAETRKEALRDFLKKGL